ncbi:MAG: peptide ABC transporter ATP-binding protein [Elusimicrobia bacterium]|nr:MAG: peptide ABC transporter ATP-binding protein [Elusimicrobiota bacterium]
MSKRVLEVENLTTEFHVEAGIARAVDGISFHLEEGETLGIVGESGSGKSVTSLSLMRLVPCPPGVILPSSKIRINGQDILKKSAREMQKIRGSEIAMIFQDPMTALNPVFTIGSQLGEVLKRHQNLDNNASRKRGIELLDLVGIPDPTQRIDNYPHQLSGGMRQRAMIAMALSCNPKILIADEPTTALDVTIQAQILELISKLQKEIGMATILITHDLAVVAEVCDRVAVMYCGRIVEESNVFDLFEKPQHPYTRGLISSIPRIEDAGADRSELYAIPGMVPDIHALPDGCRFADRCFQVEDKCRTEDTQLADTGDGRRVSCLFPLGQGAQTA